MLIIRKLNLISVQSWTYLIKEKLEMAFASPLGLKVGEGVPREPLVPSPGYAPESDDFVEKSTI